MEKDGEVVKRTPREIMKSQTPLRLIKIEEVQNCRNCKYNKFCPIPRKHFAPLKIEARESYNTDVLKNQFLPDDKKWMELQEKQFQEVFWPNYVSSNLPGKCVYELQEIDKLERLIEERYDLTDPKVFLITREMMKILLHAYRCDIILAFQGMHSKAFGKHGYYEVVNPIIEERQEFSKLIIDTIERLDKMVHGQKLEVNLTVGNVLRKLDGMMDDQKGVIDAEKVEKVDG